MSVLQDKIAVVTGGSRGIGRAIVQRLARDGARVVFSYRSDHTAAEEAERSVRDAGGHAVAVQADHENPASLDTLFGAVAELDDRLHILVNNAALVRTDTISKATGEDFDRVLAVNAKLPMLAMRRAARMMPDYGRIINISTLNTVVPAHARVLYMASKAALEQLGLAAAQEFGGRGITVNNVLPGAVDTELLWEHNTTEALEGVPGNTALRRLGRPADVANVVAFLAGPDSQWITGQNLRATGGLRS